MLFDFGLEDFLLFLLMLFCVFAATAVLYSVIVYISRFRLRSSPNESLDEMYEPLRPTDRQNPPQGGVCPICYAEPPVLCIETNCAHLFCGDCLRILWGHNNERLGFHCPMCRCQVTLLFQAFSVEEREAAGDNPSMREDIIDFIRRYNYRQNTSGAIAILDRLRDVPILLRHLFNEFRMNHPIHFSLCDYWYHLCFG